MAGPSHGVNIPVTVTGPFGLDAAARKARAAFQNIQANVSIGGVKDATSGTATLAAGFRSVQQALQATATNADATARAVGRIPRGNGAALARDAGQAASAFRLIGQEANTATRVLEHFSAQTGISARRFIAFTAASAAIYGLIRAVKAGVGDAVSFEREMVKVAQVSEESRTTIQGLEKTITSLATNLGVSSKDLVSTAAIFKQAGLSIQETESALSAVAKASLAPNFGSIAESAEGLIAVFRQFNVPAREFEGTLGAMNEVAGKFAVEGKDLVEVVRRAGGAFSQTGGSLNELLALFTAVRGTTRESAESISTGLRTIFTRLQRADTVDALKDLNINLRYTALEAQALGRVDLENQFVGAYEAVRRLSQGLAGLRTTDPRYASVIETLGGYRQISRVIPLVQQFGEAQKALSVAQGGGISLTVAQERAQDALAIRASKLREEFSALFRSITKDQSFKTLAELALNTASAFIKLADAARPLVPLLVGFGAARLINAVGTTGLKTAQKAFTSQLFAGPSIASQTRFASGGKVEGPGYFVPGTGNTDSVPAMLTPGEFVLRKEAAQRLGYGLLQRHNTFASGGFVTNDPQRLASYHSRLEEIGLGGIDPSRVLSKVIFGGKLRGRYEGIYLPKTRSVAVNVRNGDALATYAHELFHGIDFAEGRRLGRRIPASYVRGSPLHYLADLGIKADPEGDDRYGEYRRMGFKNEQLRHEFLAHGISALVHQALASRATKNQSFGWDEIDVGHAEDAWDNADRFRDHLDFTVLPQIRKRYGYASGGPVDFANDPQGLAAFYLKNRETHLAGLDPKATRLLDHYVSGAGPYNDPSNALYDPDRVGRLDSILRSRALPRSSILYRGISRQALHAWTGVQRPDRLAGTTHSTGNRLTSTSFDAAQAGIFGSIRMRIAAPGGTPGFFINPSESEFLLPRGLPLRFGQLKGDTLHAELDHFASGGPIPSHAIIRDHDSGRFYDLTEKLSQSVGQKVSQKRVETDPEGNLTPRAMWYARWRQERFKRRILGHASGGPIQKLLHLSQFGNTHGPELAQKVRQSLSGSLTAQIYNATKASSVIGVAPFGAMLAAELGVQHGPKLFGRFKKLAIRSRYASGGAIVNGLENIIDGPFSLSTQSVHSLYDHYSRKHNVNFSEGYGKLAVWDRWPPELKRQLGLTYPNSTEKPEIRLNGPSLRNKHWVASVYTAAHELGHGVDFEVGKRLGNVSPAGYPSAPNGPLKELAEFARPIRTNQLLEQGVDLSGKYGRYALAPSELAADSFGVGLTGVGLSHSPSLLTGPSRFHPLKEIGDFARDETIPKLREILGPYRFADGGLFRLKYDEVPSPDLIGLLRSSPEWVNNRTFYHGTATPGLSPSGLDPTKTDPLGLYGRGIYTTDEGGRATTDPDITAGYALARRRALLKDLPRRWPPDPEAQRVFAENRPVIYRARSDFGRILDVDSPLDESLVGPLREVAKGIDAQARKFHKLPGGDSVPRMDDTLSLVSSLAKTAKRYPTLNEPILKTVLRNQQGLHRLATAVGREGVPGELGNPFIKALKGVGYDAITHTGGLRRNKTPHQVVIGLDPNDVLGLGRRSPYLEFSPFASPLEHFASGGPLPYQVKLAAKLKAIGGMSRTIRGNEPGQDSVPALLMPGEFVFNRHFVARVGAAELDYANKSGDPSRLVQKFASGGVVKMAAGGPPQLEDRGNFSFLRTTTHTVLEDLKSLGTVLPRTIKDVVGEIRQATKGLSQSIDVLVRLERTTTPKGAFHKALDFDYPTEPRQEAPRLSPEQLVRGATESLFALPRRGKPPGNLPINAQEFLENAYQEIVPRPVLRASTRADRPSAELIRDTRKRTADLIRENRGQARLAYRKLDAGRPEGTRRLGLQDVLAYTEAAQLAKSPVIAELPATEKLPAIPVGPDEPQLGLSEEARNSVVYRLARQIQKESLPEVPKRGRGRPKKVLVPEPTREEIISRLASQGIDVYGKATEGSPKILGNIANLADLIPPEVRQVLNASGRRHHVTPGYHIDSHPGFADLPNAKTLFGISRNEDGPFAFQSASVFHRSAPGVADPSKGIRSTLLHERGHDVDKLFGQLLRGGRLSEDPLFQRLHPVLGPVVASGLDEDNAKRFRSNPKESFAEGFGRYVSGGSLKEQLPEEAIRFFDRLFKTIRENVDALTRDAQKLAGVPPGQPPKPPAPPAGPPEPPEPPRSREAVLVPRVSYPVPAIYHKPQLPVLASDFPNYLKERGRVQERFEQGSYQINRLGEIDPRFIAAAARSGGGGKDSVYAQAIRGNLFLHNTPDEVAAGLNVAEIERIRRNRSSSTIDIEDARRKAPPIRGGSVLRGYEGGFAAFDDRARDLDEARGQTREGVSQQGDPLLARKNALASGTPYLQTTSINLHERLRARKEQERVDKIYQGSGYTADTFANVVDSRTAGEVQKITGGNSPISKATANKLLTEQGNRVGADLVEAQARLTRALYPTITKQEAYELALEQAQKALQENAAVVRDANGKVVGLKNSVDQAVKEGLNPSRLRVGDRFERLGDSVRERFQGLVGEGSRYSRFRDYRQRQLARASGGGQFLFGAAAFVGTSLASAVDQRNGSALEAVRANRVGSFQNTRGATSAVSGALGGAFVGSTLLPGWGTAIGAAVGGLTSFVGALNDAKQEIAQAKIDDAVDHLALEFQRLAEGVKDAHLSASVSNRTDVILQESLKKDVRGATGLFTGFNPETFTALHDNSLRQNFGPQLGAIAQVLSSRAQDLARANPNAKAVDLVSQLGDFEKKLIGITANVRQQSPSSIRDELARSTLSFQQEERLRRENLEGNRAEQRAANTFGRLAQSVQAAYESLDTLKGRANDLADVLNGTVSFGPVTNGAARLDRLGGPGGGLEALASIRGTTGGEGGNLFRQGAAVQNVGDVLPSVLAAVVAHSPATGDDFTTQLRKGLEDALKKKGVSPTGEVSGVLSSVLGRAGALTGEKNQQIFEEARTDVTGLSNKLLEPSRNAVVNPAKQILETQSRFVQDVQGLLGQSRQVHDVIGSTRDEAVRSGLARQSQAREFRAGADFRLGTLALDTPNQLAYGAFQSQQERLSGLKGGAALDPSALARAFESVQQKVESASVAFQDAGRTGVGIREAATELARLKGASADLQTALKNVAHEGERAAQIEQKRLNELDSHRQGRESFTESYLTADPGSRLKLVRGLQLAQQVAQNPRSFSAIPPQFQAEVLQTLQTLGGAVLPGFKGRTANDVRRQILNANPAPGLGQDQLAGKRQEVQAALLEQLKRNEESQKEQAKIYENLQKGFFDNLARTQAEFFRQLADLQKQDRVAKTAAVEGEASGQVQKLNQLKPGRDLLASFGVNTDEQLNRFKKLLPEVDRITQDQASVREITSARATVLNPAETARIFEETQRAQDKGGSFIGGLTEALGQRGLRTEDAARIAGQTETALHTQDFLGNLPTGAQGLEAFRRITRDVLAGSINKTQEGTREANAKLVDAGFDPNAVNQQVAKTGGLEEVRKAITGFEAAGQSVTRFTQSLDDATKAFERARSEADAARKSLPLPPDKADALARQAGSSILSLFGSAIPAKPFATGGYAFKPVGTDTVPAMLSPGEFVVNAASAQANMPMLEMINSIRGPAYLATGGFAGNAYRFLREAGSGLPLLVNDTVRSFFFSGGRGILDNLHSPFNPDNDFAPDHRFDSERTKAARGRAMAARAAKSLSFEKDPFAEIDATFDTTRTAGAVRNQATEARKQLTSATDFASPEFLERYRERINRRRLALDRIQRELASRGDSDPLRSHGKELYNTLIRADANAGETTRLSGDQGFLGKIDSVARRVTEGLGLGSLRGGTSTGFAAPGTLFPQNLNESLLSQEQNRRRNLSDEGKQALNVAEAPADFGLSQASLVKKEFGSRVAAMQAASRNLLSRGDAAIASVRAARESNRIFSASRKGRAIDTGADEVRARFSALTTTTPYAPAIRYDERKPSAVDRLLQESPAFYQSLRFGRKSQPTATRTYPGAQPKPPTPTIDFTKRLTPEQVKEVIARQKAKDAASAQKTQRAVRSAVTEQDALSAQREDPYVKINAYDKQIQERESSRYLNALKNTGAPRSFAEYQRGVNEGQLEEPTIAVPKAPRRALERAAARGRFFREQREVRLASLHERNRRGLSSVPAHAEIPNGSDAFTAEMPNGPDAFIAARRPAPPRFSPHPFRQGALDLFRQRSLFANATDPNGFFGQGRPGYQQGYAGAAALLQRQAEQFNKNLQQFGTNSLGVRPNRFSLPAHYASGGPVKGTQYLATGGQVQGADVGQAATALSQAANTFGGHANALADALKNMPRSLSVQGQVSVNVTMNGAELLSKMESGMKDYVSKTVSEQVNKAFKERFPDAGIPLT